MILDNKQKKALEKIAKQHNLSLIILFGSVASGRTHAKSDLDIAARYRDIKDSGLELGLIGELSMVFKKDVDLAVINRANPLLLKHINENAILLHGEDRDFFEFRLYAFNSYNDYAPYFHLEENFVKEQVKILNRK